MSVDIERTTIRKISLRLLPLLFVSYFVCYLDRINVGFAALTMNKDLGFTATIYALGASAITYSPRSNSPFAGRPPMSASGT